MAKRLVVGVVTASLLLALPATAAGSGGGPLEPDSQTCTVTGTRGQDTLRGTPHRDVICGRGGRDRLIGYGGDDLLRGGKGNDRIFGGAGSDLVVGGDGRDYVVGDADDDRLSGGAGGDRVFGGGGADTITAGRDDDTIDGGELSDDIDGGEGFNTCTIDADDVVDRCTYDLAPPTLAETTFSDDAVDVTSDDAVVTVRLHVTDDTGVRQVVLDPPEAWFPGDYAVLVSGDPRDGWWEVSLRFRRYSTPGTYVPDVYLKDRLGRVTQTDAATGFAVLDDNPDVDAPELVELLTPLPTDVYEDTGPDYQGVPVKVRVTDQMSGVGSVTFSAHTWLPNGEWVYFSSSRMELVRGDLHDGVWSGRLPLWEIDYGGTWSLQITATDRAHVGTSEGGRYAGPTARSQLASRGYLPIPDERGDFTFIGVEINETTPPEILSASLTPTEVSTLAGPAQVSFTVDARDLGSGVSSVTASLQNPNYQSNSFYNGLHLTSGTSQQGTWTGTVTLPMGVAPGEFTARLYVNDHDHNSIQRTGAELSLAVVTVVDDSPS